MEVFWDLLKYALPSIFLLILCYMMLSNFMNNEEKRRLYFSKKEIQKSVLLVRLQAYERLSLFLERITPDRLLVRVSSKNMSVKQYQNVLTHIIRAEFEHNLSQQIYLSNQAWRMIITAKSATVGIINNIADELNPEDEGIELGKKILGQVMEMNSFPTKKALAYLRVEVRRNF